MSTRGSSLAEPLLEVGEDERNERVRRACYHIGDAMNGVVRGHPSGGWLARRAHALHLRVVSPLLQPVLLGYLCLTFVEPPLWCLRARQRWHLRKALQKHHLGRRKIVQRSKPNTPRLWCRSGDTQGKTALLKSALQPCGRRTRAH